MESCSEQASSFVKTIQDKKTMRVNNYKQLMEKNKDDIVRTFDTALARYMREGDTLRGMFGAGFSSPNDIQREVPEKDRYLDEFQDATKDSLDGTLLLENPEKYLEMFKKNIDLLKTSVQKQQDQILGGESVGKGKNPGILNDHIEETKNNFREVIREAEKISDDCRKEHDKIIRSAKDQGDEQQRKNMKKMSELGEKRNKFCRMYSMASRNPKGACSENLEDMVNSGYEGIAVLDPRKQQQAYEEVTDFYDYCSQVAPSDDSKSVDVENICLNPKDPGIILKCQGWEDYKCSIMKKLPTSNGSPVESLDLEACEKEENKLEQNIVLLYRRIESKGNNITSGLGDAAAYCGAENDTGREILKGISGIEDELIKANQNGVAQ